MLEGLQGDQLPPQLQGRRKELQSCLRMEAVVQALDVGRVADAQKHLIAAEQRMGVSSEVTGKAKCSWALDYLAAKVYTSHLIRNDWDF